MACEFAVFSHANQVGAAFRLINATTTASAFVAQCEVPLRDQVREVTQSLPVICFAA
jgi:hypothetical protein